MLGVGDFSLCPELKGNEGWVAPAPHSELATKLGLVPGPWGAQPLLSMRPLGGLAEGTLGRDCWITEVFLIHPTGSPQL